MHCCIWSVYCLSFHVLIWLSHATHSVKCSCSLMSTYPSVVLCPERLTVCATFCSSIRLSVLYGLHFLMGQIAVSVWQIHFKVVTLIHRDEETDTIYQTNIWFGFLGVNSFFHIFLFGNCLNKLFNLSISDLVHRTLMTYRCAEHMKHNSSMLSIVCHLSAGFQNTVFDL